MKFHIFFILSCLALVLVQADNVTPKNQLEEQVLVLLNKWRRGSVQTDLFPLPSLKTINIDPVESQYEGKGVKIAFSIGEMKLTGVDAFSVEFLNVTQTFDNLEVSAKLTVPVLSLNADTYRLKGRAYYFYTLQGHGKMRILFKNVAASIFVRFANINGVSMKITDFTLEYKIGKVDANLEKSSWPINQVLNREGAQIIQNYHDEIVGAIREYALPYANDYLVKITPEEFLKIMADISINSHVIEENDQYT